MSKTYKATGINLKTQALGEADKLVTILTPEFGLIRAVAPGARKYNSSLGGRSEMFVVNELLIAKGRSLDKITQAQTIKSYPGLAKNLGKLAASQYLAEIVLCQALSEQPQEELYELLQEHLSRIEAIAIQDSDHVLAYLTHGVFHLLALAGLTPQVQVCCLSGLSLTPDVTDPNWQVGFSIPAGGTVSLAAWERLRKEEENVRASSFTASVKEKQAQYQTIVHRQEKIVISSRLNAKDLTRLQQLSQPEIMQDAAKDDSWLFVEKILRSYAQYHFGRSIRSATLIDSYFAANYDATV
ncbi:MAG: DNA repair protein RecO [Rhizonema sp. PD38]|nr:DNA repair protein RecO [Rhizonema sp. PD38]